MEISIIGWIVIVLSIITFFLDDKYLLYVTVFFSPFVAASAVNINITTTAIIPFEIPMVLWSIKQVWYLLINRISLKKVIKENKIVIPLLAIIIITILGEISLAITKFHYEYVDILNSSNNAVIGFSGSNITQPARFIAYIIFIILVSIRVKNKNEIQFMLNFFVIVVFFASIWGIVQYNLFQKSIPYPEYLFNNNPWYYQGHEQTVTNFKRVSSIATEASVFVFIVITGLIVMLSKMFYKKRFVKLIYFILFAVTFFVGLMSTSSTAVVLIIISIAGILNILLKKYSKKKVLLISLIFIVICSLVIIIGYNMNIRIFKRMFELFNDVILNKLTSESGNIRLSKEIAGFTIFSKSPILGVGFGSYRTFTMYVNLLVNIGVFGFGAFLYYICNVLKQIIKNRNYNYQYFIIFFYGIIGMLMAFAISIPDLIYLFFWLYCALGYNYFSNTSKRRRKIL